MCTTDPNQIVDYQSPERRRRRGSLAVVFWSAYAVGVWVGIIYVNPFVHTLETGRAGDEDFLYASVLCAAVFTLVPALPMYLAWFAERRPLTKALAGVVVGLAAILPIHILGWLAKIPR